MATAVYAYTHTQASASSSWAVPHNLNTTAPMVSVVLLMNGVNTVVVPQSIAIVDANNITIGFTIPVTGSARIV
jgi:hypothetical protein